MKSQIHVIRPGPMCSVQDLGRSGQRQLGICPGGALDTLALTLANRLVGNADQAAGLEITLGGCELLFGCDTRIAFVGSDFGARLDGRRVRPDWSVPVRAGQLLRMDNAGKSNGLRSWLAVAGGIDVAPVLGSRSTDLKAGFGGHHGRALRKDDRLPIGTPSWPPTLLGQPAFGLRSLDWWARDDATRGAAPGSSAGQARPTGSEGALRIRVLPGPDHDQFTAASKALFWDTEWRLTPQSNRMGSRLAGPELTRRRSAELLSAGVVPGVIQVPPSGQPIVLMGDAQTTGGYPRIGVVLQADMGALARLPLQGLIRFVAVDAAAAREARKTQRRYLSWVNTALAGLPWTHAAQNSHR